jgi:hypothetical protein
MAETQPEDIRARTFRFALQIVALVEKLPNTKQQRPSESNLSGPERRLARMWKKRQPPTAKATSSTE